MKKGWTVLDKKICQNKLIRPNPNSNLPVVSIQRNRIHQLRRPNTASLHKVNDNSCSANIIDFKAKNGYLFGWWMAMHGAP